MLGCTVNEDRGMTNIAPAFKNLSEVEEGVRQVRKGMSGFAR